MDGSCQGVAVREATELAIRAATQTATARGVRPDRCDILQNGNTLVLRLTDDLVARVVQDREGPRQGTGWFEREIGVAAHLARRGAPVIPLHPKLRPGPYEHLGFPINFWKFVSVLDREPAPAEIGRTLWQCHEALRGFEGALPEMAILTETLAMMDLLRERKAFPPDTLELLRTRLEASLAALERFPRQPLHGDAHPGNLLATADGLIWTDWEDTFRGPVEWDLASLIWNARILEEDHATADGILDAYREAGGAIDGEALHHSLIARAAVMSAWYPILYPDPSPVRREKLRFRLKWLEKGER